MPQLYTVKTEDVISATQTSNLYSCKFYYLDYNMMLGQMGGYMSNS